MFAIDTLKQHYDPGFVTDKVTRKKRGKEQHDMNPNVGATGISPSAGGNLAHGSSNDTRFQDLLALTEDLGKRQAQGEDVQIQHLLAVTQNAFEGVVDNTENKWGNGVDDATKITEAYWKARNANVVFNPKAANQRKTISCVRQVITLGGWSKGGPGEPIDMVNTAMTEYKRMRKDPSTAKRLKDAANFLIDIARKMKRSDTILELEDIRELTFKPTHDLPTVEDVLDNVRHTLKLLETGKHKAGTCNTSNVSAAIKAVNRELKDIADAKRTVQKEADIAEAAPEIEKAADAAAAE